MTPDKPDIIETTLLRGQLKLMQPRLGFHASTDTVFLAASVALKPRALHVLDVGCGVGSAGLCVTLKNNNISLIGLDIQPDLIDIAHLNSHANGLADRCRFFAGDLTQEKHTQDNAFDVVMANPPYQEAGTHTPSPRLNKALSHGEDGSGVTLAQWAKYAHRKLKQGGALVMIHRADRLDDIILALTQRRWFGSLEVFPLFSRAGDDAKRVILRARKERYAPLALKAGLVVHEKDGSYTTKAAQALDDLNLLF